MKLQLHKYADKGCWISDDRVNAFISCKSHGIAELGYHGKQPVSRNSRMFVGTDNPVLSFAVKSTSGVEHPLLFDEVDWGPGLVKVEKKEYEIEIAVKGRCVSCLITSNIGGEVFVRFGKKTLNTNVQGEREWSDPAIEGTLLKFSCRDRIILNEWLQRTGPYAGDFLIPEPMRRMIFRRAIRSGRAAVEDVKPEFRNAPIPIYDADVFVSMGGNGFASVEESERFQFVAPVSTGKPVMFTVEFGDSPPELHAKSSLLQERDSLNRVSNISISSQERVVGDELNPSERNSEQNIINASDPSLSLPGFPRIEEFFRTVPGLVRSSIIRDYGMPRATPAAYYWIWAWDSLVTGIEMLRWGDRRLVGRMIEFVNSHRDEGGLIPGRWTRSLLPLDTPPRGAIEFLFALLVYKYSIETNEQQPLIDAYPFLVTHLHEIAGQSDERGMFASTGFYPDLPSRFGRSGHTAVAMEAAAHFSFCRLMENVARLMQDSATEKTAGASAELIQQHFMEMFWDEDEGFLVDSVDTVSGEMNPSYPIFTLLFLQSPPGLSLIRRELDVLAQFLSAHNLGQIGTSMVPSWDRNRKSEDATGSWYPHWDVYLLKLLRRTGRTTDIIRWLNNVEQALEKLGFCPEFVRLDPFDSGDPNAWSYHGAASNLNCATGWYRALVEGVLGIEIDAGGMTVVPASLPFETICLNGLVYRNSTWQIILHPNGKCIKRIVIDGEEVTGCMKIPSRFYNHKPHTVEIWSDDVGPSWAFCEVINAEVLDVLCMDDSLGIVLRPLGTVDVVFTSDHAVDVFVDGRIDDSVQYIRPKEGVIRIHSSHETEVKLKRNQTELTPASPGENV